MEKGVPIRSISRSISVLQAVNRHGSMSLMEIAHKADIPYPTACRIVQTLLFEGLIEREPARKRYRPTALVHTLSHGFQSHDRLVSAARRPIVELTGKFGWPISITTRLGQTMMVRDSTHALTTMTFHQYYLGYTLPLLECASGRVYVAFLEEAERRGVLSGLRKLQEHRTEPVDMLSLFENGKIVEEIRSQGYATKGRNPYTANPGKTSSIAVPLFDGDDLAGAMTLIFFASAKKMSDAVRQFAPELKAAAAEVTQRLAKEPRRAA